MDCECEKWNNLKQLQSWAVMCYFDSTFEFDIVVYVQCFYGDICHFSVCPMFRS